MRDLVEAVFNEGLPPEMDVEVVQFLFDLTERHALVEAVGGDGHAGAVAAFATVDEDGLGIVLDGLEKGFDVHLVAME